MANYQFKNYREKSRISTKTLIRKRRVSITEKLSNAHENVKILIVSMIPVQLYTYMHLRVSMYTQYVPSERSEKKKETAKKCRNRASWNRKSSRIIS